MKFNIESALKEKTILVTTAAAAAAAAAVVCNIFEIASNE
jgi:hypothetical protein